METEINILIALADELAAARRWSDARAVQVAIMQMRAAQMPSIADDVNEDDYRAVVQS